ncbi:hypothetical protein GGI12_001583 [Dipsacomyces acuminosporus]|nr:hypothetical protein GGI12_001583 [Dipsacomyces acuminosporus]
MIVPGRNYMAKTNSLQFEYDLHLRPLNSCRAKFFKVSDAQAFATSTNNVPFAGSTLRADFVTRESVPNPTVEKYIGHALGRLVYLYGYPPYVNQHQIRDFYKDYEIVDTVIPGVQPAPQQGVTFLSRRGAFILQFATPSEARRFVRDVYMTEYNPPASQDLSDDIPPPTPASTKKTASTGAQKHYLKAILLK